MFWYVTHFNRTRLWYTARHGNWKALCPPVVYTHTRFHSSGTLPVPCRWLHFVYFGSSNRGLSGRSTRLGGLPVGSEYCCRDAIDGSLRERLLRPRRRSCSRYGDDVVD